MSTTEFRNSDRGGSPTVERAYKSLEVGAGVPS